MRRLVAFTFVACAPGCQQLLGITDPTPASGGDGGSDGPTVDSSPPCVTAAEFAAEQSFAVGGEGKALVVGQFDRATGRDLAIAVGDGVQIMSGNGTGSFSPGMKITTQADGVVTEDFDADGDLDLIVWDEGGTSIASILQDSTVMPSTFGSPLPLTGPFTALQGAHVGYLDGQPLPDLLVKDGTSTRPFTSRLGTPGTFAREASTIGEIVASDTLVAVRQINGDGRDDAAFVTTAGDVKLAFGGPVFSGAETINAGAQGRCVGFGKLDGDDAVDLIVGTSSGGVIYRGGGGSFARVTGTLPAVTGPRMQVIDLNGDAKDDLLLEGRIVYQCDAAMAGGPGVFTQFESLDASGPLLVADINGDTRPDLLRLAGAELKVRVQR